MPRFFHRAFEYSADSGVLITRANHEIMEAVPAAPFVPGRLRHICLVSSLATAEIVVAELNRVWKAGVADGLRRYTWWADGVEMVGTCGVLLSQALVDLEKE